MGMFSKVISCQKKLWCFKIIKELEIPAKTPVLKMDEVGHIINPQVSENELLLNAGQRILIDKSSGKLKGKLI